MKQQYWLAYFLTLIVAISITAFKGWNLWEMFIFQFLMMTMFGVWSKE